MSAQEQFLKETQFELLKQLQLDQKPAWGIMTPQHMVEHLSSLFLFTIEKIPPKTFYSEEKLVRNYNYLIRDKQPMVRNLKHKAMPSMPPLRFDSIAAAITKLEAITSAFYAYFDTYPDKKTMHPACGLLNFEEWEYMHYAHAKHHLIQFGLIEDTLHEN